jgi:hypothetical protein
MTTFYGFPFRKKLSLKEKKRGTDGKRLSSLSEGDSLNPFSV